METETVDNDMAAHREGSRIDTDTLDREAEAIKLDGLSVAEVKPKTKKAKKTSCDWELCNSAEPIWTRKPDDIEQDEYDEFYKSITKDKNGPIKTSSSGRSSPPKSRCLGSPPPQAA